MDVRKASKDEWRNFCNPVNELPMSAGTHTALSRFPLNSYSSIAVQSGLHVRKLCSAVCNVTFPTGVRDVISLRSVSSQLCSWFSSS
jgi:hypothetical protein